MSNSGWFFGGRTVHIEFREIGPEDNTTVQYRKVFGFLRYQYTTVDADGAIPPEAVGDDSNGFGLTGNQGSNFIRASSIFIGGDRQWVCVVDDAEPQTEGVGWYKRNQRWEMRDAWADYTWPT